MEFVTLLPFLSAESVATLTGTHYAPIGGQREKEELNKKMKERQKGK